MEHDSFLVIEWFQNNFTKLNGDKYHLLVGGYKQSIWAKIGDARISESNKQKLLGIYINKTLSFDKEAGRKLSVLARLSSYMTLIQRRVLMNSFIEAQFAYCPLIWMFHGSLYGSLLNWKIFTYTSAHYELCIETP